MQNIITKEKIEQLERFNSLIQVMDKMSNNMQLLANRIVTLEQRIKELENEKK
jgi:polyhydroxyalkanoate synthesis regulator phasin